MKRHFLLYKLIWLSQEGILAISLYGVVWTGSQFVAVGQGTALTSRDGITWTPQALGFGLVAHHIA